MNFELDPKLAQDSSFICDLPLSQVRLSHNAAFPWIVLIPRQPQLIELIDLSLSDQGQLWQEITRASHIMRAIFSPTKLNVANLGNVVAQLHIHVIARFASDKAWPNPVWNSHIQANYLSQDKQNLITQLRIAFQG
ncbi:MAG: HIT domain-containing protein [Candidatus Berkiella sp.]